MAVAYLFFVFIVYAFMDLRRWQLRGGIHLVQGSFDLILNSRNDLYAISQHIQKLEADAPLSDAVRKIIVSAAESLPKRQQELEALRRDLNILSRFQWFRLIVIELGAPILLGSVALWKTCAEIIPFVRSVFAMT